MIPYWMLCHKKIVRICALFVLLVVGVSVEAAQNATAVIPNGVTIVTAESTTVEVRVAIKTHEIQISQERPSTIRSNCTYSKYPCSIVDYIDVFVNKKRINVPRSIFCDLADLSTARLNIGKDFLLTLTGGDASESYIVKINFDKEAVHSRSLSSLMLPDKPLQETNYYIRVLDDQ